MSEEEKLKTEIITLKTLLKHLYENSIDKGVILHCDLCQQIENVIKETNNT